MDRNLSLPMNYLTEDENEIFTSVDVRDSFAQATLEGQHND